MGKSCMGFFYCLNTLRGRGGRRAGGQMEVGGALDRTREVGWEKTLLTRRLFHTHEPALLLKQITEIIIFI
jgi:hypothetical protein